MSELPSGFTREDEYEDQLYGYCCKDVSDSLTEIVYEAIKRSICNLKEALVQKQKSEEGQAAVEHACNAMTEEYMEKAKAPMKGLREKLSPLFSLPAFVLLPEDEVQRKGYTIEDEIKAQESIRKFKYMYRRAQCLKTFCYEELAKIDKVVRHLKLVQDLPAELSSLEVVRTSGENSFKSWHQLIQNLLSLEVREASLKLSGQPSCAESYEALANAIIFTELEYL